MINLKTAWSNYRVWLRQRRKLRRAREMYRNYLREERRKDRERQCYEAGGHVLSVRGVCVGCGWYSLTTIPNF